MRSCRWVAYATHSERSGCHRRCDDRVDGSHRLAAVRAHLLEMNGDTDAARSSYVDAARRAVSIPERRYLISRAAKLPPLTGGAE